MKKPQHNITRNIMPVRVLANDTYSESLELWKNNDPDVYKNRFIQAAERIRKFTYKTPETAVETAFDILREVTQTASTKWSIVFDIKNFAIHYRTFSNPNIRYLDTKSFDFSCKTPVQVLDINGAKLGDIGN
ncbi:MAG: hypothetical protein GY755_08455, partial [Chloroflexi bacterium]|nr:hypothetical protein [Chloroflexota bacterium]